MVWFGFVFRENLGEIKVQPFCLQARKEIFKIHTQDWIPKPLDTFLEELAEKCVGKFENKVSYCM